MLDALTKLFRRELLPDANDTDRALQLAAATLLLEVSHADYQTSMAEQQAMEAALTKAFQLNAEQLRTLLAQASAERQHATSLYPLTRLINDSFSAEQRSTLVGMLWQVAAADGDLHKYEEHLIRKIADLIYLPHSEFIRRKLEALGQA